MVYVDNFRAKYRTMIMCHMVADTLEELHEMADKIGVKRKWFQGHDNRPHYDICKTKRALAIKNGAVEVSPKEIVQVLKKYRVNNG